jgi:hypothetical protein
MATLRFTVEVQPDFIERQAKARPIEALAWIIWNGLDADAVRVDLRLSHGEFGLSGIMVTNNGHGISHADAPTLFTRLGGSSKQRGGLVITHISAVVDITMALTTSMSSKDIVSKSPRTASRSNRLSKSPRP